MNIKITKRGHAFKGHASTYNIEILTLRAHTVFFYFLKKRGQFRCTGLLRSSKLVHLDGKILAGFL